MFSKEKNVLVKKVMSAKMITTNNVQILMNVLIKHMTVVRMQFVPIQYCRSLAHVDKEAVPI